MKPKIRRKKLIREDLENQLAKAERRIQKIAENAYMIRQQIELFDRVTKQAQVVAEAKTIEGGVYALYKKRKAKGATL